MLRKRGPPKKGEQQSSHVEICKLVFCLLFEIFDILITGFCGRSFWADLLCNQNWGKLAGPGSQNRPAKSANPGHYCVHHSHHCWYVSAVIVCVWLVSWLGVIGWLGSSQVSPTACSQGWETAGLDPQPQVSVINWNWLYNRFGKSYCPSSSSSCRGS